MCGMGLDADTMAGANEKVKGPDRLAGIPHVRREGRLQQRLPGPRDRRQAAGHPVTHPHRRRRQLRHPHRRRPAHARRHLGRQEARRRRGVPKGALSWGAVALQIATGGRRGLPQVQRAPASASRSSPSGPPRPSSTATRSARAPGWSAGSSLRPWWCGLPSLQLAHPLSEPPTRPLSRPLRCSVRSAMPSPSPFRWPRSGTSSGRAGSRSSISTRSVIRTATSFTRERPGLFGRWSSGEEMLQPRWVYLVGTAVCIVVWRRWGWTGRALWAFVTMVLAWNLALDIRFWWPGPGPSSRMRSPTHPATASPSGHAANTAAASTTLVILLWPALRRRGRTIAVATAAVVTLVTAADRVLLGVHYPSRCHRWSCAGAGLASPRMPVGARPSHSSPPSRPPSQPLSRPPSQPPSRLKVDRHGDPL